VSELTSRLKGLIETQFRSVSVRGEISNLRIQSSGHAYFGLKDEGAQLSCVMFKSAGAESRRLLADGLSVVATGEMSVYEPRGQYQLVVRQVALEGQGALQLAFERLKQKLREEGLFDPGKKRPIPRHPQRAGVVTSPTGAALRDVCHVLARRDPGLRLLLAPCRVQGLDAAREICAALEALNQWSRVQPPGQKLDVILTTRGGGSLEDLWCFNEESVARAIRASVIPVISAVGHEIDFTIADFAADLRAATPSAAAEILSEGAMQARDFVEEVGQSLFRSARRGFDAACDGLDGARGRLARAHPRRQWEDRVQRVDEVVDRWQKSWVAALALKKQEARALGARVALRLLRPRLDAARMGVQQWRTRLESAARHGLNQKSSGWESARSRLRALSPDAVLERGYSITRRERDGVIVRRAGDVEDGEVLLTRVSAGELRSRLI